MSALERFNIFTFHEDGHRYTYSEDGTEKLIDISVTKLAHIHGNPFDEMKMSAFCAAKRGITQAEILQEWHDGRDFACLKGNSVHLRLENLWNESTVIPEYDPVPFIEQFGVDKMGPIWPKLSGMADRLYERFRLRLIPVGLEYIVGSPDCSVAGAIDFLGYSEKSNSLIILDYKTNKEISFEAYKDQRMKSFLSHIPDCNYFTYSLQLALYKAIIERETKLQVCPEKLILWLHESNDDVVIYKAANVDKEANQLLEYQKHIHETNPPKQRNYYR
jgi:hypothetical protein